MFVVCLIGVFFLDGLMFAVYAATAVDDQDAAPVRRQRVALHRLELVALRSHYSVFTAQATLEGAVHDATAGLWQFPPTPVVTISQVKDNTDASLIVSLKQLMDSGGRLTAQRDNALVERRIAESSLEEVRFRLLLVEVCYAAIASSFYDRRQADSCGCSESAGIANGWWTMNGYG